MTDKNIQLTDKLFDQWNKIDSPGCALAIVQNGQIVYQEGYGMANLDTSSIIEPQTVFYIGSVSKQFCAMCIALCVEEGLINLDDDIRNYIPELPQYEKPITVRHLVHHTSGLRDYYELFFLAGIPEDQPFKNQDVLDILARQKGLNFLPGEQHLYSNSGYISMAILVQRVSGKTLRQFAEEKIFKPLGMTHSHFHDDRTEIIPRRAMAYMPSPNGYKISVPNFDIVGAGGLYSTVLDLYHWDQNFYHNKLGKGNPDLIRQVLTVGILNTGEKIDYAFGLEHSEYKGQKVVMHGGAYGGYRAELMRFPERSFSVILLCNRGDAMPTNIAYQIADIWLGLPQQLISSSDGKTEQKPAVLSTEQIQTLCGYYWSEGGLLGRLRIYHEDGSLKMEMGGKTLPAFCLASDKIVINDTIQVEINFSNFVNGKPQKGNLVAMGGAVKDTISRVEPLVLNEEQLAPYAGKYFCDELDCTYWLVIKEGKLIIEGKKIPTTALNPIQADQFEFLYNSSLDFYRNAEKAIAGFSIQGNRARNILCEKQN